MEYQSGYSPEEIEQMQQLAIQQQNMQIVNAMNKRGTVYSEDQQGDMFKYQLEVNDILSRVEHILRGDIIKITKEGVEWIELEDKNDQLLNEKGIQAILKTLSMYVNRNTILSDFTEKDIHNIVYDFGMELVDLFYMRYQEFGMTTDEKRKNFPMIMREIIDVVNATYCRAKEGGERRSLGTSRQIIENSAYQNQGGMGMAGGFSQKKKSILNPFSWFSGVGR